MEDLISGLIHVVGVPVSNTEIRVYIIFEREDTDNRPPVTLVFEKKRGGKAKHISSRTESEKAKRGDTYIPSKYYNKIVEQAMTIIRDREKEFWEKNTSTN